MSGFFFIDGVGYPLESSLTVLVFTQVHRYLHCAPHPARRNMQRLSYSTQCRFSLQYMDTFTVHHSQEEGICRLSNSTQSFFSLKYVDTFTVHHTQQGGICRDSHTLHSVCCHSCIYIPDWVGIGSYFKKAWSNRPFNIKNKLMEVLHGGN